MCAEDGFHRQPQEEKGKIPIHEWNIPFWNARELLEKKQRGEHNSLGVRAVQLRQFFSKFITELIEISFFIIETDAHRLKSVFRPIMMRFFVIGLIGLKKKKLFFLFILI